MALLYIESYLQSLFLLGMNKCGVHVCFPNGGGAIFYILHSPECLSKDLVPVWSLLFCKHGSEGISLLGADEFKRCWHICRRPLPQFCHLYLRVLPSGQDLTWEQFCCWVQPRGRFFQERRLAASPAGLQVPSWRTEGAEQSSSVTSGNLGLSSASLSPTFQPNPNHFGLHSHDWGLTRLTLVDFWLNYSHWN